MPVTVNIVRKGHTRTAKVYEAREVDQLINGFNRFTERGNIGRGRGGGVPPNIISGIINLKEELDTLNNVTLPGLQNDLDALQQDLDTLNNVTLPDLQDQLDQNDADIANLQGELDTLNTVTIPNLQAEIDQNEQDIAALEGDLNDRPPGVEVVTTLPTTDLFEGRVVYLTTDDKLYRYNGSSWIAEVAAVDITGTITETQIADDSISTPKLQAEAVTAAKIEALAITTNKLAAGAVTTDKILSGSITTGLLDAEAVTAAKIAVGTITALQIAAGAITASELDTGAVTTIKLDAEAVTAAKIAVGTITALQIATETITANELAAGSVTTIKLDAEAVTAAKIAAGTITAQQIASNTITANEIATGTITSNEINVDDLFAVNVTVAGTFTLGPSAVFRNANIDWELAANGIDFKPSASIWDINTAVTWDNGAFGIGGGISGFISEIEHRADRHVFAHQSGNHTALAIIPLSTGPGTVYSQADVELDGTFQIPIETDASRPTLDNSKRGTLIYNDDDGANGRLQVWDGSGWARVDYL